MTEKWGKDVDDLPCQRFLEGAADRIAELEAANARFKHALELIAYDEHPCIANWQNTARGALGEEK